MIEAPLTAAQEGLWLARRLDPANPSQNTGQILRLRGPLDAGMLQDVLRGVLAECDAFRVRILPDGETARLTSAGVPPVEIPIVDLSAEREPERRARSRIQADIERPRDPARDPMVTTVIYRLGPDAHWWYLCAQHLVIDGYGTTLLNVRVMDLLRAAISGSRPRTAPFASFRAVVREDARYRASGERKADLGFWRTELGGLPEVRGLKEGEPLASAFHHRARKVLPAALYAGLRELAREARAPWPDVVAAAVAVYLRRHAGGGDVVLGVPLMNRLGSASARVPCTVMNVVPVRVAVDEDERPAETAARVAARMRTVRGHGRLRSEELRRELGFVGGGRRLFGPLVNVLPFQPLPEVGGLEATLEVLGAGPVDDLTLTFRGGGVGAGVALEVDGNPALYSMAETEAHRDRLISFLTGFCARPDSVGEIPTLTRAETARWIQGVNATEHPVEDATLVELIERTCAERPGEPALVDERERLTHAEFSERTGALSEMLRAHGAGTDSVVGVLMPRSIDQVVAFVAAMRAGAAYLPLDPEHPGDRIRQLIASARPAALVVAREDRSRVVASDCPVLVWPPPEEPAGPGSPSSPPPAERALEARPSGTGGLAPRPGDAAYVIYTSGSTGEPKGVVVEHRAIVNRLLWMRAAFDFGPDDRILHKTPATFDVSVWELFLPLICGATLVVAPPGAHRDPGWLARIMREHAVTAAHFVPSMLGPFLDHPASRGLRVARVFCSGEALATTHRSRFHERIEGALHNLYGPTEAAVDVSHWPVPAHDRSDPIPIGRPVWNTRLYVLDDRQAPLPPGTPGELHIAGRQLARGYLGRDDLTDAAFVPDPFAPGERMYRTGDLATWREDGAVVFRGRVDHQVKIRGQRIELGEIESVIMRLPGVESAVAVLREDAPGDPTLVAYVTTTQGAATDAAAIRAGVGRRLPDAMVPGPVVALDELPLTTSGKVDRAALPAPPRTAVRDDRRLRSGTERLVAELYREILDLAGTPGPSDDFFALGGQSLSAIRVLAGVRNARGIDLGAGALFSRPTVAGLAAVIDDHHAGARGGVLDEAHGLEPLLTLASDPDSPGGRGAPLYCVHPAGGIAWCYRELARALQPPRRVVGLQAPALRDARWLPDSLDEMASSYVDALLEAHEEGEPVHLLGWSVGGIIAHAMALRLRELGHPPGVVVLLDAYPADCWRDQPEPEEGAVLRALLLIAGEDPGEIGETALTREWVRARLVAKKHVLGELSDTAFDGVVRVVESNNRLVRSHRHDRLEGDVIHFRAGLDHEDAGLEAALWTPYARTVEAHVVPALHAHMTGPATSARVATVLRQRLRAEVRA